MYVYIYLGIRVIVILMDNTFNSPNKNNYECLTQNSFDILETDWSNPALRDDLLPITDNLGTALCPDLLRITPEPTSAPTIDPTQDPTVHPTSDPTVDPTPEPSHPTAHPTILPCMLFFYYILALSVNGNRNNSSNRLSNHQ